MSLQLQVSNASAVESSQKLYHGVGRQAGYCKVVGIFILSGIHFSHKQKKRKVTLTITQRMRA